MPKLLHRMPCPAVTPPTNRAARGYSRRQPDGTVRSPLFGRNLDEAEAWVRSWAAQASERAAAAAQMADEVGAISSSAEGGGGSIKVAVDSSGLLTRLDLADSVRAMPATVLAQEIMTTVRRTQAGLVAKVTSVIAATVGADTETGSAVIGSYERRFPEPVERDGHG